MLSKILGFVQYSERIIMRTSISCNAKIEKMYDGIEKVTEKVKEDENLVIMGDWNTVLEENNIQNITEDIGYKIQTIEERNV